MSKASDFITDLKTNKYDPSRTQESWDILEKELEDDFRNLGFFMMWVRESDRSVWIMDPSCALPRPQTVKFPHGFYSYIKGSSTILVPAEEVRRVRK